MRFILLFLGCFAACLCSAQLPLDFNKGRAGWQFRMDDRIVVHPDLRYLMRDRPVARRHYRAYLFHRTTSGVFLGMGSTLVFSALLLGALQQPDWTPAYVGAGLIALGVPFAHWSRRSGLRTSGAYNRALGDHRAPLDWHLGIRTAGLGLTVRF